MRIAILLLLVAFPAAASTVTCLDAAREASARTGVPYDVLAAISLTETGRTREGRMQTWPWTVNVEGKGAWLDTREAALAHARGAYAQGKRSFDVGCFQLNYRWHGENFASIAEMFDPGANALYAADFLSRLHAEFGDWERAAGAYHSRTEVYARKYRARFRSYRAEIGAPPPAQPARQAPAAQPVRTATAYPLLSGAVGARSTGSLVPLGAFR